MTRAPLVTDRGARRCHATGVHHPPDDGGKLVRRIRRQFERLGRQALTNVRQLQDADDFAVQLVDNSARRRGGCEHAVPRRGLKTGHARFRNRFHVGHDRRAPGAGNTQRTHASGLHLGQRLRNVAEDERYLAAEHGGDGKRIAFVRHEQ